MGGVKCLLYGPWCTKVVRERLSDGGVVWCVKLYMAGARLGGTEGEGKERDNAWWVGRGWMVAFNDENFCKVDCVNRQRELGIVYI